MFDFNTDQLEHMYKKLSHTRQTAFLQRILDDIFKNHWYETTHSTEEMMTGQFELVFEDKFRDPLSSATMNLLDAKDRMMRTENLSDKRRAMARFGFYHISKAWRLNNTYSEASNRDMIQAITNKTTTCPSLLCGPWKVQNTIKELKQRKLMTPDPRYLSIQGGAYE